MKRKSKQKQGDRYFDVSDVLTGSVTNTISVSYRWDTNYRRSKLTPFLIGHSQSVVNAHLIPMDFNTVLEKIANSATIANHPFQIGPQSLNAQRSETICPATNPERRGHKSCDRCATFSRNSPASAVSFPIYSAYG
jgi:hypothetical protein